MLENNLELVEKAGTAAYKFYYDTLRVAQLEISALQPELDGVIKKVNAALVANPNDERLVKILSGLEENGKAAVTQYEAMRSSGEALRDSMENISMLQSLVYGVFPEIYGEKAVVAKHLDGVSEQLEKTAENIQKCLSDLNAGFGLNDELHSLKNMLVTLASGYKEAAELEELEQGEKFDLTIDRSATFSIIAKRIGDTINALKDEYEELHHQVKHLWKNESDEDEFDIKCLQDLEEIIDDIEHDLDVSERFLKEKGRI